ncbi:hypothetical protein GVAV_001235 [Gurleya vavrai]
MHTFLGIILFSYKLLNIIFLSDTTYTENSVSEGKIELKKDLKIPIMYTLRIYDVFDQTFINQLLVAFKTVFTNQFEDIKFFLIKLNSYSQIGERFEIFRPNSYLYTQIKDTIQFELFIQNKCTNLLKEQFLSDFYAKNEIINKKLYTKQKIFFENEKSELHITEPIGKLINNVSVSVDFISKKHMKKPKNVFHKKYNKFKNFNKQKKLETIYENLNFKNIIHKVFLVFCDYYVDERSLDIIFEYMKRNEEIGRKEIVNCHYIDVVFFSEKSNQLDNKITDAFNNFLNSEIARAKFFIEHPFNSIFINKPKKTYISHKFSTSDSKKNDEFRKKFLKTNL